MNKFSESGAAKNSRPKGAVWVWFSSIGLITGLLMVTLLFGLITYRGLLFFWPVPIQQIQVSEGSDAVFRGETVFTGALVRQQERTSLMEPGRVDESEDPPVAKEESYIENRIFVGNRDFFGQSFRFIREDDIVERTYPKDIIRAERRIEGDALFFANRIQFADGRTVTKADEDFEDLLDKEVRLARERRASIDQIDRREIGPINLQLRSIELELRILNQKTELTPADQETISRLKKRQADLNEEFVKLRDKADQLRSENQSITVYYELAGGTERSMAIGDLYSYYYPNRLGLLGKIKVLGIHFWEFVSGFPREANMSGGIFPAIFGTFVMTLIMSIAVTPFGVVTAIYLREYARQGPLVRAVRIAINNLAGVPSIVFGVFGLGFFVYIMGGTIDSLFYSQAQELGTPTFGTGGILWAGLTLALLNLPVLIVATEEAITSVSRGVREGSLACGASKWQTIQRLVIPAALPGILTGMILAMARGAGEVAPLMLVGVVALAPNLPMDGIFPHVHLERKFMHLGFHIYDVGFQSPDSEAAIPAVFATTLVLIGLIIILNMSAILLRNRIRRRHLSSAF